jgi:hypothetical protein
MATQAFILPRVDRMRGALLPVAELIEALGIEVKQEGDGGCYSENLEAWKIAHIDVSVLQARLQKLGTEIGKARQAAHQRERKNAVLVSKRCQAA